MKVCFTSSFVKSIRDVMRNDAGINGDAQRLSQIVWILFLKIFTFNYLFSKV